MNKELSKNLINQFQFALEGETISEIYRYFEKWKEEFHEDYTTLAWIMSTAFKELAFGLAEDLENQEENATKIIQLPIK